MRHPFRVAFTFDFGTFAIMKSLLESEGVTVLDLAMGGHLVIAGADQGYYVEVAADQKVEARRILMSSDFGEYLLSEDA